MPGALIVAIALAAVAAVFAIQNADVITVSFLGWSWDASLALVLILTLGAGVLIGYLSGLPSTFKLRTQLRQLRRQQSQPERAGEAVDRGRVDPGERRERDRARDRDPAPTDPLGRPFRRDDDGG